MRPDDWHLTEDVDAFLARAGDFLRSRPDLHTMALTVTASRTSPPSPPSSTVPLFGYLEESGEVRAAFHRGARGLLSPTVLTPEQADSLAARLAGLRPVLPGVSAEQHTSAAFAEAWRRRTGATPALRAQRVRLYRLGTPAPPDPHPEGRARAVGERDHEHLVRWCRAFTADVGEDFPADDADWPATRFAAKRFTFWETPDGTPVSMAGATPIVAGHVRVDPVYTPAPLRGRGYAGAVTAQVGRAALAAGAHTVVLFADPANPTSTALYQRLGYDPVAEFTVHDFT
ncbi:MULTISPECIES: GNAT family N-acetyltransferase [Streptomyces]|uniref:GNAT family N-acetyltransferase n=1 Tax=Streptomyces TaxID=1883 RepID=UPI0016739436|nr:MULTISPECIES: GNAT family N-acetyltransferase [Streptomyces]MBK3520745.1 GNAT family N-acetyltransferase [Streptomyces sp. MBT70]GGR60671.1 N-acetyltransferase [Streptomyces eurythermus]